jgi:flagellar biosynthesis/type III secretory pathway ATPase
LSPYIKAVADSKPVKVYGRVVEITGIVIKATGIKASIGESCRIFSENDVSIDAEVVRHRNLNRIEHLCQTTELNGQRPRCQNFLKLKA